MKRKTSLLPTRIYTYGALPPVEGVEAYEDQMLRAHRYRNGLVEIEQRRRKRIVQAQRAHDRIGPVLDAIECLEAFVAESRAHMKQLRASQASLDEQRGLREQIEAALADLSVLRLIRAACKCVSRINGELHQAYAEIEQQARDELKALRNSDEAPYWGTYLVVEKAAEQWRKAVDPPKFRRYDGSGRLAVQIQHGLEVAELLSGEDTRLRLEPGRPRRPGQKVQDTYRTVALRYGRRRHRTAGASAGRRFARGGVARCGGQTRNDRAAADALVLAGQPRAGPAAAGARRPRQGRGRSVDPLADAR
jgi:hypothetical protein